MIYDQPSNTSVSKNIESVQYNAALAITGAIKGSSCEKIVLGVRTGIPLWNKTGEKIVFTLYKVFSIGQPYYIYDLLPSIISSHGHANLNISRTFFILNVIDEWNKLDPDICSSTSNTLYCNILFKIIGSVQRKIFNINDSAGKKLLLRLHLGFTHFREHK